MAPTLRPSETLAANGAVMRRLILAFSLMLSACQLALPGGQSESAAPPDAITVEAITVTKLDAPTPPARAPAQTPPPQSTEAPAQTQPAPLQPPAPQSQAQIACERKGGTWASAGIAGLKACIRPTRDGGKQCRRESDCEGLCLARSRTCAPITPLFGCNDILQDDGRQVTLCID